MKITATETTTGSGMLKFETLQDISGLRDDVAYLLEDAQRVREALNEGADTSASMSVASEHFEAAVVAMSEALRNLKRARAALTI